MIWRYGLLTLSESICFAVDMARSRTQEAAGEFKGELE
jgi:hypothetical protein